LLSQFIFFSVLFREIPWQNLLLSLLLKFCGKILFLKTVSLLSLQFNLLSQFIFFSVLFREIPWQNLLHCRFLLRGKIFCIKTVSILSQQPNLFNQFIFFSVLFREIPWQNLLLTLLLSSLPWLFIKA